MFDWASSTECDLISDGIVPMVDLENKVPHLCNREDLTLFRRSSFSFFIINVVIISRL